MSLSSDPRSGPGTPVVTRHRGWIPPAITGLIIGTAFIAIYVGLQRAPEPSQLPIAVVGEQLATTAHTGFGDAVAVTQVANVGDGEALVRGGDAVAVLDATSPGTLTLDYAGASGLSESSAARSLAAGLAERAGATVQENDIVPLTTYDSRGLSSFYVVFGVTLSSFILAQGLTAAVSLVRLRHRLYSMGGFAVAIGVIAATVAGPIYGSLTAPFPLLALSLILLSAATAFTTKALGAWLGPAGIGLAVLILTTIGNATSGATIGVNLLPGWAQAISAKLPPGAAVRAVTNFGYFDGAHTLTPLAILAGWLLAGLGFVLLRQRTAQRRALAAPTGR